MPATAAPPIPTKKNCGNSPRFQKGNTCQKRSAAARSLLSRQARPKHGQRLKSLEQNAAMAQAHHEALAKRGAAAGKILRAIDRSIALKRRAHAARQQQAAKLRAGRDAATPAQAPSPAPAGPNPAPSPAVSPRSIEARRKIAERLRKVRAASRGRNPADPAAHTNHPPGHIGELDTSLIHFDPARFQYKLAQTNHATGSVGSLAGVKKYDPELGGVLQVWKDPADGRVLVVNGHNRLDLAKKLSAQRVAVKFLDAKDATEARSKGALTNIAEGRGTSLDAAKFFRDTGINKADLERRGVPLRDKIADEGLAMANLADPIFRRVIDGTLPAGRAALIGGSGLSHPQQMDLVKFMDSQPRGRELTDRDLREFIDNARSAGSRQTSGGSLFGDDDAEEQSLALHRARVQGHIKERLGREKRLFGTVAKSKAAADLARGNNQIDTAASGKIAQGAAQALDVFDRLKNSSGPIAKHLNRAAERIAKGEPARTVHSETYDDILASLDDALKF